MFAIRCLAIATLLSMPMALVAEDELPQLTSALEKYRAGDFDGAIERLEPLLKKAELSATAKQRAGRLAAQVLEARGSARFREGQIAESIADFDRQLELMPEQAAGHWKRGIAYYYAGKYEAGKQQFELHQRVNPQDVENAAWHFLCAVRAGQGSVATARKQLIPITKDPRPGMAQIQQMFAGAATPEEVLRSGKQAGGAAEFYADLYVALYYEALDRRDESLRLMRLAAEHPASKGNYMGDVARVHVRLRTKEAEAAKPHSQQPPTGKP